MGFRLRGTTVSGESVPKHALSRLRLGLRSDLAADSTHVAWASPSNVKVGQHPKGTGEQRPRRSRQRGSLAQALVRAPGIATGLFGTPVLCRYVLFAQVGGDHVIQTRRLRVSSLDVLPRGCH
jgi:hypothetical protein